VEVESPELELHWGTLDYRKRHCLPPSLHGQRDWRLHSTVRGYITGNRGSCAIDVKGVCGVLLVITQCCEGQPS
jgi:hypothetical protein